MKALNPRTILMTVYGGAVEDATRPNKETGEPTPAIIGFMVTEYLMQVNHVVEERDNMYRLAKYIGSHLQDDEICLDDNDIFSILSVLKNNAPLYIYGSIKDILESAPDKIEPPTVGVRN